MTAWDVVLVVLLGMNAFFWLGVVPMLIVSLVIMGGCRAFFGAPVIVWRGLEAPDIVAIQVMKAATEHVEEADEDEEAGLLDRMR